MLIVITAASTHAVDSPVSNDDTSAALHIDNLVDGIHAVSGTVERHVSCAAVYQLLILQYAVSR